MANGKLYPGGVDIATPFEMNDSQPIVSYMVVDTIANRDLLPNQFDGMNTFVVETQVMYCKTNAGWVPIGVAKTFQELMESNPNTTISPIIPNGTVSGAAVNKSQLDTKQDKSGNDGIRYVLFNGGLVQQIDTNTNVINTDLTQTSNRVHNLGAKILRFINGIFQVPALTFDETTANTVVSKVWYDGAKLWLTNKLGINKAVLLDGDIVDASETSKGLVTTGAQTFKGDKVLKGNSISIGNVFEIQNGNNIKMFQVDGEGTVTMGVRFSIGSLASGIFLDSYTNAISISGSKVLSKEGATIYIGQSSGWTSVFLFAGNTERARTTNGGVGYTAGFKVTGNLEVTDGIVLKDSVSGNKFKITVNASGVLSTAPITF